MKSLRILWAKADFLPLRLGLSRLAALFWPKGGDEGAVLEGALALNPANGAPFRGLRPAGGAGLRGADLIVQAFPSKSRHGPLVPLHYGPDADVAALLAEALPRLMAARRDGAPETALPTVSLALGRLIATQDAIAAGLFEPSGLKLHAWDKLLLTSHVTIPPAGAPDADALRRAADRLRAVFGAQPGQGRALLLGRSELLPAARATAESRGEAVGLALDPDRAVLRDLIPALLGATAILAADPRASVLAGLRGDVRVTALWAGPGEGKTGR